MLFFSAILTSRPDSKEHVNEVQSNERLGGKQLIRNGSWCHPNCCLVKMKPPPRYVSKHLKTRAGSQADVTRAAEGRQRSYERDRIKSKTSHKRRKTLTNNGDKVQDVKTINNNHACDSSEWMRH